MKIAIQLIIISVYPIQLPVGHGQLHLNSNSQKVYRFIHLTICVNIEPLVGQH